PLMLNYLVLVTIAVVLHLRVRAPEHKRTVSHTRIDRLCSISKDGSPKNLISIRVTATLDDVPNPPITHGIDRIKHPSRGGSCRIGIPGKTLEYVGAVEQYLFVRSRQVSRIDFLLITLGGGARYPDWDLNVNTSR